MIRSRQKASRDYCFLSVKNFKEYLLLKMYYFTGNFQLNYKSQINALQ